MQKPSKRAAAHRPVPGRYAYDSVVSRSTRRRAERSVLVPALTLGTLAFALFFVLQNVDLPSQEETEKQKEVRKNAYLQGHKSGIFHQWQKQERGKAGIPEPSQGGPPWKKFSAVRKASKEAAYKQFVRRDAPGLLGGGTNRRKKRQEKGSECTIYM